MKREEQIDKLEHKCTSCRIAFFVCMGVSIALVIWGFCVPPQGQIDGSVLKAVGEMFGFAALAVGAHGIELGYDLKVSKGDTEITLGDMNKKDGGHGDEA